VDFLFSRTLQLSFKAAAALPWTLFYRNPLTEGGEDRFECSFDKVPDCSLYPVTYLLPLKESSSGKGEGLQGIEERRFPEAYWQALKIFSSERHPKCIARTRMLRYLIFGNTPLFTHPKEFSNTAAGHWWVIVLNEYHGAYCEYLFSHELSARSASLHNYAARR